MKLGHPVALKFLPPNLAEKPERLGFFHSEVRLTRQISHPNVCRVYDIGEVSGQHFLSMEYIDGEDLAILLRRIGRLPKDKGIQIARQLCAGLAAAHERGVLHRDLKPANIMIDGRGQVRITDFGLARLVEESDENEIVGTPAYMAPEQLEYGKTTIQSDLYSLGLILYELFTGEPVHKSSSVQELIRLHQQESVSAPSSVQEDMDPAVERVILRCLEHEAYQRPKSVREVAAGLPGSDPLAVALAAGETPSPEMVAAAGDARRMDFRAAKGCVALMVILLGINFWLEDKTSSLPESELDSEPAVMADVARQVLAEELGYDVDDGAEAYGYKRGPVSQAKRYQFWYRRFPSGEDLDMDAYWSGWAVISRARPDFDHPAWGIPKESGLILSGDRKLLYMRVKPPLFLTSETSQEPVWSTGFSPERTGYFLPCKTQEEPPSDLPESAVVMQRVTEPVRRAPDAYDQLAAWKGHDPGLNKTIYVIAASFQNRPTYYQRLTEEELMAPHDSNVSWKVKAVTLFYIILLMIIQVLAAFMAWRHYFLGRGDRRGAARLAFFVFVCGMLALLTQTRFQVDLENIYSNIFCLGVAQVVHSAAVTWVWYMALEPYARRNWPQMLISTSRLLQGRIRDPRVGGDLLVGGVVGVLGPTIWRCDYLARDFLGLSLSRRLDPDVMTLAGLPELVGAIADRLTDPLTGVFLTILVLIAFKIVLGTNARALAGSCCLWLVPSWVLPVIWNPAGDWWIGLIVAVVTMAICLFVLVRFGALALVVGFLISGISEHFPFTLDTSKWYFGHGVFAAILVLMIVSYGYYISQVGRCDSHGAAATPHT